MNTIKQETAELNTYFGCYVFTAVHPKTLAVDAPAPVKYGYMHPITSVRKVYANPSESKLYWNEFFVDVCTQLNGFDFAITSSSCMFFTCEWKFVHPINGRPMRGVATGKTVQAWYIDPATITSNRIDLWARHGLHM